MLEDLGSQCACRYLDLRSRLLGGLRVSLRRWFPVEVRGGNGISPASASFPADYLIDTLRAVSSRWSVIWFHSSFFSPSPGSGRGKSLRLSITPLPPASERSRGNPPRVVLDPSRPSPGSGKHRLLLPGSRFRNRSLRPSQGEILDSSGIGNGSRSVNPNRGV